MDRDDRELVRRCLQKDEDAWAQLAEAYARMVGTVIWRATGDHDVVEDLAQETFLRVFRGLPYFDQRAKLSTWIYKVAWLSAVASLSWSASLVLRARIAVPLFSGPADLRSEAGHYVRLVLLKPDAMYANSPCFRVSVARNR